MFEQDRARNLSMVMDFYELTMSNGYFKYGFKDKITYFDVFYRSVPDHGGFAIGTGNCIAPYVPTENYLNLLEIIWEYRGDHK